MYQLALSIYQNNSCYIRFVTNTDKDEEKVNQIPLLQAHNAPQAIATFLLWQYWIDVRRSFVTPLRKRLIFLKYQGVKNFTLVARLGRNVTFHAVLCGCTWIMYVTLCAVGLQWHKMNRKCPQHPSSSLLTTAAERNRVSTGYYFFACLVFSPHHMNVFVTDFTIHNVMTHVQGFSSGILIIFC